VQTKKRLSGVVAAWTHQVRLSGLFLKAFLVFAEPYCFADRNVLSTGLLAAHVQHADYGVLRRPEVQVSWSHFIYSR
jgi:hypothetical protein